MGDAKFKVGDWVYIGDETSEWSSIVKISRFNLKENQVWARNKQNELSWFNYAYVERLAKSHEIPNYKPYYEIYY